MTIRVECSTAEGVVTGVLARSGHLRDVLGSASAIEIEGATWRPWMDPGSVRSVGAVRLAVDDILAAVGDDDPPMPIHVSWHPVRLGVGPLMVEGELPTLPGYDPGRALTRPAGEFVLLRGVRITPPGDAPTMAPVAAVHVNRYAVGSVTAGIMLGFYFPGAQLEAAVAVTS